MHPILLAVLRGRRRDPAPAHGPLWRLLLGELAWAGRQALHPAKLLVAAAGAVGVGLVLGPATPGPVLGAGWLLAASVLVGFVALAVAHALMGRAGDAGSRTHWPLVVLAGTTMVFVGTLVLASLLAVVTRAPPGPGPATLSGALPVDGPLLVGAAAALAGVLVAGLGARMAVPGPLLFLGLGLLLGSEGLGVVGEVPPDLAQGLGVVALSLLLFDAGLGTTGRDLRLGGAPGLALATLGVAVTAGATALGAGLVLDLEPRQAWVLGAVVASTDAGAVLSLLRRTPLPARLAAVLRVESAGNDPVAVLLTVGLLAAWDTAPTAEAWFWFGAAQLVGGLLVGAAVGWCGGWLLQHARLGAGGLYPVLALAIAGVAHGAAAALGGSGFLAVFVAGAVLAVLAPRRRVAVLAFHDALASGVEVGLFLLLGLLVRPSTLAEVLPAALVVAVVLLLVARPLATAVSLAWFDVRPREVVTVAWLGLRGASPVVLATFAVAADVAGADVLLDVVLVVVALSILVQGSTAGALVRRLGLAVTREADGTLATLPLDGLRLDVVEVDVPVGSALLGSRLAEVAPPDDVLLVGVVRDDEVLLPRGGTRLSIGDHLVLTTTDRHDGAARVAAWVQGGSATPASTSPSALPPSDGPGPAPRRG